MPSKILNTLTLVPAGRYGSLGLIFDIIIDGKNLLDGIRDFESQYSKKIAGAYQSALGERDIASLHSERYVFVGTPLWNLKSSSLVVMRAASISPK